MNAPFGILFPLLAVLGAVVAIVAGADYAVALPFAVGSVALAAIALGEAVRRSEVLRRPGASRTLDRTAGVRAWFHRGTLGREEILMLVDRLDRGADRPDLPIRLSDEVARLVRLPEEQFRAYVNARLDSIEGTA
ncbi:MAG TPA: hypothetical protein VML94_06495 [Thermoplasmata archaeon]|nr:hypothetical protein [Thermoplasmata archaeon]